MSNLGLWKREVLLKYDSFSIELSCSRLAWQDSNIVHSNILRQVCNLVMEVWGLISVEILNWGDVLLNVHDNNTTFIIDTFKEWVKDHLVSWRLVALSVMRVAWGNEQQWIMCLHSIQVRLRTLNVIQLTQWLND